ncbi:transposase [Halomonas sp. LBP4]|nr:transposase [Halomonas sp. LBP4]
MAPDEAPEHDARGWEIEAGQAIALSHAEFEALIEGFDLVVTKR